MKMKKALLLVVLTGLLIGGCGKETPEIPKTPSSAMQAITQGLNGGNPAVVWEAIPASYQKDVTGLAHEFAANMDAEIYNKAFGMLGKATNVLKTKRDFFLNSAFMENVPIDKEKLTSNWNTVVDLFTAVTASELNKLENLKTIDIGKFIQKDGAKIFSKLRTVVSIQEGNPLDMLADVKVELVQSEGDSATVKMTLSGEKEEELDMIKVEGKWIPKEMAEDWPGMMTDGKAALQDMTQNALAEKKPMVMGMMAAIEAAIDQLAQAKTQEEFDKVIGGLMGSLMGGSMPSL
jgi:hypothetical protein